MSAFHFFLRRFNAHLCAPVMRVRGRSLGWEWRMGRRWRHRFVNYWVDVMLANQLAGFDIGPPTAENIAAAERRLAKQRDGNKPTDG